MTVKEMVENAVVERYLALGNKEKVARELGISRATIYRILSRVSVIRKIKALDGKEARNKEGV